MNKTPSTKRYEALAKKLKENITRRKIAKPSENKDGKDLKSVKKTDS